MGWAYSVDLRERVVAACARAGRPTAVLGASIVGAEAGEPVHVFVALMAAGASVRAVVEMEAVHPSFAEGLQSAVMALKRYAQS